MLRVSAGLICRVSSCVVRLFSFVFRRCNEPLALTRRHRRSRAVVGTLPLLCALWMSPAFALSTLNVNTTSMAVATDGVCSLVEALRAARNKATVNDCVISGGSPVVINLQSGATYSIGAPEESDSTFGSSGFLIANEDVTINGNGSTLTQSQGAMRVLMVRSTATLRNLTISGGRATNTATALGGWGGGVAVINSAATLNLENVTLVDNGSAVDGGSILVAYSARLNMHRSAAMGNGTGLYVIRVSVGSTANIANTTLYGPSHALNVGEGSTVWVSSSTLSGSQYALFGPDGNTVRVQNSILDGACLMGTSVLTSTNNAAGASSGCSPTYALPALWPWSLNGGSTPTMVPKQPNATRNALGSCTYQSTGTNPLFSNGSAVTVDQRGATRDANCDVGAVEAAGISPSSLSTGTVGLFYSQSLTATGAASPFTFAVSSGALPGGLSMDSAGVISGTPSAAGSFGVDITLSDNAGFKSIANYSIVVNKASQSISFPAQSPGNRSFVSGGQFGVNPLAFASSGLTVSYASTTPAICSVSVAGQVTMQAAGTCTVQASQSGNANYNAAPSVTQNIIIDKAAQSISWGAQAAQNFVSGGTFAISPLASSSAGLSPIVYGTSTPAICSVSGTTVTMVASGVCTLTANQAGDSNTLAASQVTVDVTIGKATQSLSWGAQAAQTFSAGGSFSIAPLATSSAGLTPVVYGTSTPGVCTVSGTTVTIVAAGTCTLTADQAGDANFQAASTASVNVNIGKAGQSLSWGAQAAQVFAPGGSFAIAPLATSSAGLTPVVYASTTPAVCTVSGSTVAIVAAGTCVLTADQAGNANYLAASTQSVSVTIGKAGQSLSWGAQAAQTFAPGGMFSIAPLAVSSAGLTPVSYSSSTPAVCSVSGTTVSVLAAGLCTLTANQAGDANHLAAAMVTTDVTINKATQSLSWGAQSTQTYSAGGSFSIAPLAVSSAGLTPVTYSSNTPAVCTVAGTNVSIVAAGTCTIAAAQAGDSNYQAAPLVTVDVTINKAAQSLSWGAQSAQTYSVGGSFSIAPLAVSSVGLTPISYGSSTPAVCTVSGTTVSIIAAGACTLTANQAGDANYAAATQVTSNVNISKASQTLGWGPQPSRVFAPAGSFAISPLAVSSAGLSGITYGSATPTVCTVSGTTVSMLSSGLCRLTANQAGDANYLAAAAVTVDVNIDKAAQSLAWPAQSAQTFTVGGSFAIAPLASSSAGLSGIVYGSSTPAVCTVSGTTVSMQSAGICTLTATHPGNSDYLAASMVSNDVTIGKATQSLSWTAIAAQTFAPGGSFTITPQAVASSGLTAITYASTTPLVCTVSGTTVSILTAGTCRLTAAQAGDSNYQAAPTINQDVVIAKAGQTLTFPAQPARSYAPAATFPISPLATASSGLTALVYGSSTPTVCTVAGTTVTIVAAGLCTLTADQAGDGNYNAAAQVSVAVTINLAVQTISFPAPTAKVLGVQPFTVTVSGGASGNAVLVTSATPARCTATGINGTLITLLATGTCTLRANQAGNANHAAAAQVEVSFDINASATLVKLASSSNPARWRQPVTFTIDVVGINVTGEVDVLDGIETLCAKLAVVNGRASCTVGNLAEDGHSIRAYYRGDANNTPAFSDELVQVVSRVGSRQGAWWGGPAESGWGLSIVEHGETLVIGWYFYDSAGKPTWLTVNGCAWDVGGNRCSGALRRGQASWLGAYRADSFVSQEVGQATLAFDEQGALFSYVVNGVAGSKRIMRMDLGGNPYAPFDYSDVWWGGPSENGWGVAAFVAGQSLVGIWYTYDAAGQPTWFLFNGGQQRNPRAFQAYLYRPQGTPFGMPYNAAQHSATHVGEIYFDFDDVRHGTMTYQLEGLLQFKPFLRVPF